jgi:integrase
MGRITVDGAVAQFSLKADAHPDRWDTQKGRMKGNSAEKTVMNRKIEQAEIFIKEAYSRTILTAGYVTAEQIKNEFTGIAAKAENLLELLSEHNREYEKRLGIDRKHRSYEPYKQSFNHLSGFISTKYGLNDFPLKKLDLTFITDYNYYLRVDAGLHTNTAFTHVFILKKMMKRAISQGVILYDPFEEFVPNRKQSKYLHISGDELEKIMSARISSKSVRFVRDMFVFSCFTGLAYSDMCNLSEKHLSEKPDGSIWIEIPRYKTDVESHVRLLDIPLDIIEKYLHLRENDRLFKIPTVSFVSRTMRKIEELCGIKHLHFHMARHTFATLICLSNGISMKTLSKLMGHTSMRTTKNYGEITNQRVGAEMKKHVGRPKRKKRGKVKNEKGVVLHTIN